MLFTPQRLLILSFIGMVLLIPGGAMAAETGTLQGVIMDADGRPLPGALVTVEGGNLQGARKAVTGENGEFRILSLPPGMYTISSEMDGFQTAHQTDIRIRVGTNTQLAMEMLPARVVEEITVKAEAPTTCLRSTGSTCTWRRLFLWESVTPWVFSAISSTCWTTTRSSRSGRGMIRKRGRTIPSAGCVTARAPLVPPGSEVHVLRV